MITKSKILLNLISLNRKPVKKILLSSFVLLNLICFGQNIKVSGKSYRPMKYKLLMVNAFNNKYYNGNQMRDSAAVDSGKFEFVIPIQTADIPYAYVFADRITENSFYNSDTFFISSKTKNIVVGKENLPQNFEVTNDETLIKTEVLKFQKYFEKHNIEKEAFMKASQKEYEQIPDKEKVPQEFWDQYTSSENRLSVNEDSILLNFVKNNPNSFVALWKLVEKFERNGYSKIYDEIFSRLSSDLKSKPTAETLRLAIKEASVFQIGKKFPGSKIKNIKNPASEFTLPKAEYTLVDFWFSSCKPCLEQMPNYVQFYSEYKSKGFEIVGIATDQKQYKNNLESTIQKFKIPWNNYWDEDGKQSSDWTITSFPTNYLLDKDGNIVAKNISEKELSSLLSSKLK